MKEIVNSKMLKESTPAILVESSSNSKISRTKSISTTWVSQHSCPECPFKGSGCYAETGPSGIVTHRLNENQERDPVEIARSEAMAIRRASGKQHLRLHSVGDCSTKEAAEIVSEACGEYSFKHNKSVWTYTHARDVPRTAWAGVSVLRSCETEEHVNKAHEDGYAAALVVENHKSKKAVDLGNGFKGIPCPQQTGAKLDCNSCQLCFHDNRLRERKHVILFETHGNQKKKAAGKINELRG